MRHSLAAMIIFFIINSAWSQDYYAADTASDLSAYDIFGLSPSLKNETTGPVVDTMDADRTDDTTTSEGDGSTEIVSTDVDGVEGVAIEEEIATEVIGDELTRDYSADEEVLLVEISRLLTERDELYGIINELRAENIALTAHSSDMEFYKNKATELEAEIEKLEGAIQEKDAELSIADSRLIELEVLLAEESVLRGDAESRLAIASGDASAVNTMIEAKDALIAERDAVIAGKDEALARKDGEIEARDRALEGKGEAVAVLSERLLAAESELVKAQADLLAAEARGVDAAKKMAEEVIESKGEHEDVTAESANSVESNIASAMEVVADAERRIAVLTTERDAAIANWIAAEDARATAESGRLDAEKALSEAKAAGTVVEGDSAQGGFLSGWKLDSSKLTRKLRDGFDGSSARLGVWKIAGTTASQSDASQYFSRLEMPLAQSKATTLYRFKARSTGKGWIGLGLHLFVEDVKKKRGYGEGKSLLVWFTRDKAARGDDATYVQLYRSDDDVVMERMFDAELSDGLDGWRLVEVVYDPGAEYIAVSVDGSLRIVYKTFFGRDVGVTVSLRTLGGGASFSDFSVWSE